MASKATKLQDRLIGDTEASLTQDRNVAIDAPTGSGKSRIFSKVAENGVKAGERSIILTGRKKLARDALKNIKKWSKNAITTSLGVEGKFDQSGQVVSTTVQTANRNIDDLQKYDRVIIDEAHHALEGNDDYTRLINQIKKNNPQAKFVFASATYPDGMQGMVEEAQKADKHVITFEEAIAAKLIDLPKTVTPNERLKNGNTIAELVADHQTMGHGSDAEGVGSAVRKNLPENWNETLAWQYSKHFSETQTISFFDTVKEAEAFAKEVREFGIEVQTVHSGRKASENDKAFDDFESGKIKGLVSVDMISEGYDVDARGLFLAKLTTSAKEYRQIVGRGARSFGEDKSGKTLLVDMGSSTHMHGEISAQASINNIAKNIESTSRATMDLSPESKEAGSIWKQVEGGKAYAAPIDNTIVYAIPSDNGYIAMQSLKDRKGSRIQLLSIDGERKGRPSKASFCSWAEKAIQASEKSLARLMSKEGGIDALIAADWQKNATSIQRSVEMMTQPMMAPPAMGMAR